jgi:CHAT domain-containing protein
MSKGFKALLGKANGRKISVWLFLISFFLVQSLALFFGTGRVTVAAQIPTAETVVQTPARETLLERGKVLYDAGKFSEAVVVLQQAVAAFKAEGDGLREAIALSNLALAYQQLGSWSEAEQALTDSLKLLQSGENVAKSKSGTSDTTKILAQTLEIQGRLQLSLGKAEQALTTWQQASNTYAQIGDRDGIAQSKINQAQALQNMGLNPRACTTILNALGIDNQECKLSAQQLQTLKAQPASSLNALGLRSLGDTLQLVGDLKQSEAVLKQSLEVAEGLKLPADISAALLGLGNNARAQRRQNTDKNQATYTKAAIGYYQQAADQSTSATTKLQAQLNELSLLVETKQLSEAEALWREIQPNLATLPPNRTGVDARINLAQSLLKLSSAETKEVAQQLAIALQQAKNLGDQRAMAYALGNLAGVYEQTQQLDNAKELTDQALLLAQTINAPDIAYRWQWQLGRLLKAQGNRESAMPQALREASIAAYDSAVKTLQSLRGDLVRNPDVQFSFRESVEPVYREFVELLLESQGTTKAAEDKDLKKARDVIESLQLAELVNFLREDCLNGVPVQIDQVDQKAAVIYPIVLKDRLEVVLALPNAPLRHYTTPLQQAEVEGVFTRLREAIAPLGTSSNRGVAIPNPLQDVLSPFTTSTNRGQIIVVKPRDENAPPVQERYITLSQKVYDWLIRPAEQDIAASNTKTLVFVLDGSLRNLPMAVLHDGKQFLVEKYAIALTPGLQLLDAKKTLPRVNLTAFKGGLSKARQNFPALPYVKDELEQIRSESKVSGKLLLDESFTSTALQKEIDSIPFPVIHLATHGQFSSNAEDTFILTWDGRLNVKELNDLLRSREESGKGAIELLVLSACQTAAGDKRAALGLAGVAVRAGARSTVATLWFVSDAATAKVMTQFYRELSDTSITKAEALRRAQVSLLKSSDYQEPIYWAPYVMIGNWL